VRPLDEERVQQERVTLPLVKLVNEKFKSLFKTEKVGLNSLLSSEVFKEVSIGSETASKVDVNAEKISMVKMLA